MQSSSKKLAKKPNVVFIVADCFRSDHAMGKSSAKTPFLDSLREKSTVFTQAISTSSSTSPNFVSLFTGCYSFKHVVRIRQQNKKSIDYKLVTEAFKEAGYYTIAEPAGPVGNETVLRKGFDEFNQRVINMVNVDESQLIYGKWGENLVARLKGKKIRQPFFLFIHLWILHRLRFMTKQFNKRKYGKVAYQRSISCLDFYLEKIFKALGENTIVVITGDHGEIIPKNKLEEYFNNLSFACYYVLKRLHIPMENPKRESHGFNASDQVVRIPLLFHGKPFPKGKVVKQQVSQLDIAVTLAKALGLDFGKQLDGRDLMPLMQGKSLKEWPAFIEACGVKIDTFDWVEGIRTSKYKYLHGTFNEKIPEKLFDLEQDPGEEINIANENPITLLEMREKLHALKEKSERTKLVGVKIRGKNKKKVEQRLKELGYL